MPDFYNISIKNVLDIKVDKEAVIYLEKINNLIKTFDEKRDNVELDNLIVKFIKDKNISRENKINTLWLVFKEVDTLKNSAKLYCLDYLSVLNPVELTDNLINEYKKQDNEKIKNNILNILVDSIFIANPNIQNKEQLDFIANKEKKVHDLVYSQILKKQESEKLPELLILYSNISSTQEVKSIVMSIIDKKDGKKIYDEKLISALSQIAITMDKSQSEMLLMVIKLVNNNAENPKLKKAFDDSILEVMSSDIGNSVLSENSNKILFNYFKNKMQKETNKKTLIPKIVFSILFIAIIAGIFFILNKAGKQEDDGYGDYGLIIQQ